MEYKLGLLLCFIFVVPTLGQIDSCTGNLCQHGYCETVGSFFYRCNCYAGFTGRYCDERFVLPVYAIVLIVFGVLTLIGFCIGVCVRRKNMTIRGRVIQSQVHNPPVISVTNPMQRYPTTAGPPPAGFYAPPGYPTNPPPYTFEK